MEFSEERKKDCLACRGRRGGFSPPSHCHDRLTFCFRSFVLSFGPWERERFIYYGTVDTKGAMGHRGLARGSHSAAGPARWLPVLADL